MKHIRGEHAWIALGLYVIAYDAIANEGELLSEVVDRFIEKHPAATRVIVIGVAAHLMNLIPPQVDPLHKMAITTRRYRVRKAVASNVIDIAEVRRGRKASQAQ